MVLIQAGLSSKVAAAVVLAITATSALAQSTTVRRWGNTICDTAVTEAPAVEVRAVHSSTLVRLADGRLFGRGGGGAAWTPAPPPPPGLQYTSLAAGLISVGILSDGSLTQWGTDIGGVQYPLPTLPAGVTAVAIDRTYDIAIALLSDGSIVAWGSNTMNQLAVPTLAAGLTFAISAGSTGGLALVSDGTTRSWAGAAQLPPPPILPPNVSWQQIELGANHAVGLRSDGLLEAWGSNSYGQLNVPVAPAGLHFTSIDTSNGHCLALRSDGQVEAWGRNDLGQCNVPAPPPGTYYAKVAVGDAHSVALRSDGVVTCWGWDGDMQGNIPALPQGRRQVEAACGAYHQLTLLDDGAVQAWGGSAWGLLAVPTLPAGVSFVDISAGYSFSLARCSDDVVRAWGDNSGGQLGVPSLPLGVTYLQAEAGLGHAIAIRSDGQAVGWGFNTWGECNVPALPVGTRYVAADAGEQVTLLLRSDGQLVQRGKFQATWFTPSPPAGEVFVAVAQGAAIAAAIASDGTAAAWQSSTTTPLAIPPLPRGVSYVEVACGNQHTVARRSDGQIVCWGSNSQHQCVVPPLAQRTSYLRSDANEYASSGLVGRESTYVTLAGGCAGSLGQTRLIPRDTPQIGKTMTVQVDHLPVDIALFGFGWQWQQGGVPLDAFGLTGCSAWISFDAVVTLVGQNGRATWDLAVPYQPTMLGTRFYNQAIVLDPMSGNPAGLVVSAAARGVVGG